MFASQKLGLTLTALSAVALLTSSAHAQTTTSITVVNNGFEDPAQSPGGTYGNVPTGWVQNATIATNDSKSHATTDNGYSYATGVQAGGNSGKTGNQYGFVTSNYAGGYDLEQNTGFTATVGDTYTLTADAYITNFDNANNFGYARIALTDGNSTYLGPLTYSNDVFAPTSVTFTAMPGTGTKPLTIDLLLTDINGATTSVQEGKGFAGFDNVQLTETAPAPAAAPEPSAWAGLAVGALGLGALSLRARRRTLSA